MRKVETNVSLARKVVSQGGARTISVGKILPHDWLMVKISVEWRTDKCCVLVLEKIM